MKERKLHLVQSKNRGFWVMFQAVNYDVSDLGWLFMKVNYYY